MIMMMVVVGGEEKKSLKTFFNQPFPDQLHFQPLEFIEAI
jgi:hypothetical protein